MARVKGKVKAKVKRKAVKAGSTPRKEGGVPIQAIIEIKNKK